MTPFAIAPLVALLAAVTVPTMPELTERQAKAVAAGKVVMFEEDQEGTNKFVQGLALIEAEPAAIWALLLDEDFMRSSSGAVDSVAFYDDRTENGIRRMGIAWVLKVGFKEVKYSTLREYHIAEAHMTWTLDPAKENDLASTTGSYTTLAGPRPGTTYLIYKSFFDAGKSLPSWLEETIAESGIKKYLKRLVAATAKE
jgi:hypothetical protein